MELVETLHLNDHLDLPLRLMVDTPSDPRVKLNQFLGTLINSSGFNLQIRVSQSDSRDSSSHPNLPMELTVEFFGPDTRLLTSNNGELLLAIEHIAEKILRLDADEHHRISFCADGFKASRAPSTPEAP